MSGFFVVIAQPCDLFVHADDGVADAHVVPDPGVLDVRLAAVGADEHAKAARVRGVDACLARELVDRLVGDDRDGAVDAVDGASGRVGASEAQLAPRELGERLRPRALHDPPWLVTVVEPGRDGLAELDATLDDRAVGERERKGVGVGLPLRPPRRRASARASSAR